MRFFLSKKKSVAASQSIDIYMIDKIKRKKRTDFNKNRLFLSPVDFFKQNEVRFLIRI